MGKEKKNHKGRKMPTLRSCPLTGHMSDQKAMSFVFGGSLSIMFAGRIRELCEKTFI